MTGPAPHPPPEWAPHRAMWLGFPSRPHLWGARLAEAQAEVAALARLLAGEGRERVRLVVRGRAAAVRARALLAGVPADLVPLRAGDVWLRDTGPLFLGAGRAAAFRFNGWGRKHLLDGDRSLARRMAQAAQVALEAHPFVLEGGALDHDGAGSVLAVRSCVLHANRNVGWSEPAADLALRRALGVRKVLWLGEGLVNDHTDGHVDNLARFVAPGVVVAPAASDPDDPNARVYDAAAETLSAARDAQGRRLSVVRIPSPGRVEASDGAVMPASHMNFIIANGVVAVPTYGAAGTRAVDALAPLFPGRSVVGLPSSALLSGGGAFHCISQPEVA